MPGNGTKAVAIKKQENQVAPIGESKDLAETLISQAIEKNVPIETLERLLAMRTQLKDEFAKQEFDKAMSNFQGECPVIKKGKEGGKTKTGIVVYKYAPLDVIVSQTKELIRDNGFSYMIKTETKPEGVKVICTVKHLLGHSEDSSMEIPLGNKTEIMSQSQVVASAITFAKRYAFCNAFGILTGDEDDDAKKVGDAEKKEKTFDGVLKAINDATLKQLEDLKPKLEKSDKYSENQKKMLMGSIDSRIFDLKEKEESK